jgi:hypothetical protein
MRRAAINELISGTPAEFGMILKHIDDLKFYNRPDYKWIMKTLREHLTANKIEEHPYDWEPGANNRQGGGGGGGGAVNSYFR